MTSKAKEVKQVKPAFRNVSDKIHKLHSLQHWKTRTPPRTDLLQPASEEEAKALHFVQTHFPSSPLFGDWFEQKALMFLQESYTRHGNKYLSPYASNVLKVWYFAHLDYPYPSLMEKEKLGVEIEITGSQVQNWFANIRKRYWLKAQVPQMNKSFQPLVIWKDRYIAEEGTELIVDSLGVNNVEERDSVTEYQV